MPNVNFFAKNVDVMAMACEVFVHQDKRLNKIECLWKTLFALSKLLYFWEWKFLNPEFNSIKICQLKFGVEINERKCKVNKWLLSKNDDLFHSILKG